MRYALLMYGTGGTGGEATSGIGIRDDASGAAGRRDARTDVPGHQTPCPVSSTSHDLADTTTATTLRLRGGRVLLTDGPVAEHHEQLRGVVVIDVRDLDEAIAVAAGAPDAREGAIEIRPVREPR